ncbi:hypothetical protein ROHU_002888 [Labeo rohita]|uniref:Uncharacterized protein n=1 Tax=Labeo rohita TaxID=84645 RepID=A0A498NX21_LABRO|nr:hypothetical protein ROHU_002888 [Labeo rohita]
MTHINWRVPRILNATSTSCFWRDLNDSSIGCTLWRYHGQDRFNLLQCPKFCSASQCNVMICPILYTDSDYWADPPFQHEKSIKKFQAIRCSDVGSDGYLTDLGLVASVIHCTSSAQAT